MLPKTQLLHAAVALLGVAAASFAPAPTVAALVETPPAPVLLWADEFNADRVDLSRWNIHNQDYASNEASCLFATQVAQGNGVLSIRVDKGDYTCGSRHSAYASGSLDSVNKVPPITVGDTVEFRAKLPITLGQSQGYWPALWLRSNEQDSDYSQGEIDTVEVWGATKPDITDSDHASVHTVYEDTNTAAVKAGYVYRWPAGHPGDGYHVYQTRLLDDRIQFLVDGTVVREVTTAAYPWVSKLVGTGTTWNLRINVQVCNANSWCSAPNAQTVFGQTMDVDYVRVYRP